jgi:hypothetical protein
MALCSPRAVLVEIGASVAFVESALEPRVVALQRDHGVVHVLADTRQLGVGLKVSPAGLLGYPEEVGGEVFVLVLGVRAFVIALAGDQPGVVLVEAVGGVFEKDQAEDGVLVLRRVHVVVELVRGEPELGLEAEVGGRVGLASVRFTAGHSIVVSGE